MELICGLIGFIVGHIVGYILAVIWARKQIRDVVNTVRGESK